MRNNKRKTVSIIKLEDNLEVIIKELIDEYVETLITSLSSQLNH